MVKSILKETKTMIFTGKEPQGLDDLLMEGVFQSKHCSHKAELEKKKKSTERFLDEMALWNDLVLVGKDDKQDQQEAFINKLKEQNIKVVSIERNGKIFYGLQAPEEIASKVSFWNCDDVKKSFLLAIRIGYLNSKLNETKMNTDNTEENKEDESGLKDLMKNGVFETKFCSHEKLLTAYDFVLVGQMDEKDQQEKFINKLEEEEFYVERIEIMNQIFYGVRAHDELIEKNLREDWRNCNMAIRIRLVNFVLNQTKINTDNTENNTEERTEDLEELMKKRVFENKYCLHEALLTEYYYILIGKESERKQQEAFIEELKEKKIEVKEIEHNGKIFYGLRATEKVFEDYCDLLKVSKNCNSEDVKTSINLATRIRIVDFILNQTRIDAEEETGGERRGCAGREKIGGLEDLLTRGVFETKFCLHEESGQRELKEWAQWKATFTKQPTNQPFKKIRDYFGEKVALYYLWLGWYTTLLVPAALLGVLVFLSGIAFFNDNPLIKEVCESNITMCPRCEKRCPLWRLSDTCAYAKVSYLFDNTATVVFAVIMAIWATTFLALWKRYRAKHVSQWKVYDWCEEEEELILEIVNDSTCKPKFFQHYALEKSLLLVMGTVMMLFIYLLPHGLVILRASARGHLSKSHWKFMRDYSNTMAVILGSVVHFIIMQLMTLFNRTLLKRLYRWVYPNSRAEREKGFNLMMFTFQFFTLFSKLFYVAFFLGRTNGYPGNYARAGGHRLDECHPSGCLTDLFIQMLVIMILKQVVSSISEITKPRLQKRWRKVNTTKGLSADNSRKNLIVSCVEFIFPWMEKRWRKTDTTDSRDEHQHCWKEKCDECLLNDWQKNYQLADSHDLTLFYEMLKMVIQFSLTTLFVAAFPLAPFLALINNIFEIRLDAIKMVRLQRRLISKKTNNMGIWTMVLETIGVLAVIANSLVIGITSDFIPRLVYRYGYGPCATGVNTTSCMSGYINSTLTTAYMNDNHTDEFVLPRERHLYSVTPCSFRAYRSDEDHSLTAYFWWVLAARFAFVFIFEQGVLLWKFILAWLIPDDHLAVKNERLEDKLDRLKEELKERRRTKSRSKHLPY